MKKIMMTLVMAVMAVMLAGCSKESKYESLLRETAKLVEEGSNGMIKVDDAKIKKELEEFKKLSDEEKDKEIKKGEEVLQKLKEAKKKAKK